MTKRGNADKDTVTVYVKPNTRRRFKEICAQFDLGMSALLEAFMENEGAVRTFIRNNSSVWRSGNLND